jgi:hypothetical protein
VHALTDVVVAPIDDLVEQLGRYLDALFEADGHESRADLL